MATDRRRGTGLRIEDPAVGHDPWGGEAYAVAFNDGFDYAWGGRRLTDPWTWALDVALILGHRAADRYADAFCIGYYEARQQIGEQCRFKQDITDLLGKAAGAPPGGIDYFGVFLTIALPDDELGWPVSYGYDLADMRTNEYVHQGTGFPTAADAMEDADRWATWHAVGGGGGSV